MAGTPPETFWWTYCE